MVCFVKPQQRYIRSYWESFGEICREGRFLSSTEPFSYEDTEEFVLHNIQAKIPQLFAVDTKLDRCVGWCDALPKTEVTGYLGTGLLAPYREQGIGTRLIREVIDLCAEYGYREIELDVRSSNKRAIHVYRSLGFVEYNVVQGGLYFPAKLHCDGGCDTDAPGPVGAGASKSPGRTCFLRN